MRIIIEIQKTGNQVAIGTPGVYDNNGQAEQAYHTTLSYAAVSSVEAHSVVMLSDTGDIVKKETYYHEPAEA